MQLDDAYDERWMIQSSSEGLDFRCLQKTFLAQFLGLISVTNCPDTVRRAIPRKVDDILPDGSHDGVQELPELVFLQARPSYF
jgi:hypothetical protein